MGRYSYNRPLQILLLLWIELHTVRSSLSCDEMPNTCECFDNVLNRELELQCPSSEVRNVVVRYTSMGRLHVTCHNPRSNLAELDLKMHNAVTLKIERCRSSNGFKEFFGGLNGTSKLTEFKFNDGNLENADLDSMSDFFRLSRPELVFLNRNGLRKFPDVFQNLPSLIVLDLSHNIIGEVSAKIRLNDLILLKLESNSIETIEESVFEFAPNLRSIDLSNNRIDNLPGKLLHPLPNLTVIMLSGNNFRTLPDGFFEKNTALKDVILNNGRLTAIESVFFSNFTKLVKLKMRNNLLTKLPENFFANLSTLEYLELSSNSFTDFPEDTFTGLVNLEALFLSNNNLSRWSVKYNRDLVKLKQFVLTRNSLTEIEQNTFAALTHLRLLDLSHNLIREINIAAFIHLNGLNELNLSFNRLTTTTPVNVPFGKRIRIILSFNNITHIELPVEKSRSYGFSKSPLPKSVCLIGNPLNCDCESYDLIKLLKNQSRNTNSLKMYCEEKCKYPLRWEGTKLKDINLDEFTCQSSKFYNCPPNCSCEFHPTSKTVKIDCSNLDLTELPVIAPATDEFSTEVHVEKIWVNLANNSIRSFTENANSYEVVSVLNLSGNNLTEISWIPSRIEGLHLDNNLIAKIDERTALLLNNSRSLKRVTLSENPWSCDCEMAEFANILRTRLLRMISNRTISCTDGSSLMELEKDRVCSLNKTLLAVLIVLCASFAFLFLVLVALYLQYEHHIKIWLYNHKLLLSLIKAEDLDQNRVYDAFVSYSHKDEDFVAKCLVPELEKGEETYKLCLHARDWIVGEYIPKQIADSVRNSRRTIIVLSRHFLNSDWATIEFKTAHSKFMSEERNRLIVILYEDIDISEITNEDLRIYLNTNTYIKWGDPWFWKKLKSALPERITQRKSTENRHNIPC